MSSFGLRRVSRDNEASVGRSRWLKIPQFCTLISMLDLAFVRDHLPLMEEKLRQRGMDPAGVLKDFAAIDARRRQAITGMEAMKAQRTRASEEIARLKKAKQ